MITILHGDDIHKSRTELNRLRASIGTKEVRQIDGKSISNAELVQALSSQSMFGNDTIVVIENLFSSLGKKIKRQDELLSFLLNEPTDTDIIIWEDKPLSKSLVTKLSRKATVLEFKFPTVLFQFLDSFTPKSVPESLLLYKQLLLHEPVELVNALLGRRLKQLIHIKQGNIPKDMQPWQISRLTKQSSFFTMNELLRTYRSFLKNELATKTGTAYLALDEATERLMTEMNLWL